RKTLRAGEFIALKASQEFVHLAGGKGTFFKVVSLPLAQTQWCYDATTLRPRAVVAAEGSVPRTVHALRLLTMLGSETDSPELAALKHSPSHLVRWEALRTRLALGCSREEGLEMLKRAAADPHPGNRKAANRLLATLEPSG